MSASRWAGLLAALLSLALFPVALLVLVLLVTPRAAACVQPASAAVGARLTSIIGDSLTVGARAEFTRRFPGVPVEAKGGMPWSWGLDKVKAGAGDTVAYLLGTNGGVSSAQISGLLAAHPGVRFVLMTVSVPQPYEGSSNAAVMSSARANLTRVLVADWYKAVAAQPNLLGGDRIHPATAAGSQAFVDTVATAVDQSQPAAARLAAATAPAGGQVGPSQPGDHRYTQAQMTAAVAKFDPQQAVALGAIAMAETSGWNFPTTNPTGRYHGPWAFQEASNPQLDFNRLDSDLAYAAQAAADLARTGITHGKWETWPTAAATFMPGGTRVGALAVAVSRVGPTTGQSVQTTNVACLTAFVSSGGGGVASADGLTFPLKTTRAAILAGSVAAAGGVQRWCYTSQANCHHDYNAADLMVATGTVVLAPVSGTIVSTHSGLGSACVYDNRGDNFSMRQDGNNMAWFMGHLLTGSLSVREGEHVSAGQPIGQVGRASEAQCTVPHLHIQVNPAGQYGNQQDPFNVQPVLVGLFSKLPA